MEITAAVRSPGWDEDALPSGTVVVLLHGYGSHEHDLPGLAPWLPPSMPWVSPRAPLAMPGAPGATATGFSWFPMSLPDPPLAEHVDESTTALWEWIDTHVGPESIVVPVGFSQGGVMASQLLRTRPERVGATVLLAGLIADTAQPADAVLRERRPPVFSGRGDRDNVLPPEGVSLSAAFWPGHSSLTDRIYPGLGHSVDERVMEDVRRFLQDQSGVGAAAH